MSFFSFFFWQNKFYKMPRKKLKLYISVHKLKCHFASKALRGKQTSHHTLGGNRSAPQKILQKTILYNKVGYQDKMAITVKDTITK